MAVITKKEADAWDRVLDAAVGLAELIESSGIGISEADL
jgi:dsDNA-binding SOS-regulon protein